MAQRTRRDPGRLTDVGDWRNHYEQIWKPMTTTTPRDSMTLAQFTAARQALRDALAKFQEPTCHTCKQFSMGRCELFGEVPKEFQQTPEACEAWVFDGIPFASSCFSHDLVTSKHKRMKGYDY